MANDIQSLWTIWRPGG